MSIFDDLIRVDKNGKFSYNAWIEWEHFLIPNKPEWFREILRNLMVLFGHCLNCTTLDGCYLSNSNRPEQPLHEERDCKKKSLNYSKVKTNANAECQLKNLLSMYLQIMKIQKEKTKYSMI